MGNLIISFYLKSSFVLDFHIEIVEKCNYIVKANLYICFLFLYTTIFVRQNDNKYFTI